MIHQCCIGRDETIITYTTPALCQLSGVCVEAALPVNDRVNDRMVNSVLYWQRRNRVDTALPVNDRVNNRMVNSVLYWQRRNHTTESSALPGETDKVRSVSDFAGGT